MLNEIDALRRQGVEYLYFIDEIFLPNAELLQGLVDRNLKFGVQTRIDLWKPDMLALLGRAGCVSIEARRARQELQADHGPACRSAGGGAQARAVRASQFDRNAAGR